MWTGKSNVSGVSLQYLLLVVGVVHPPHQYRQQLSYMAKPKGQQVSSRYLRSRYEAVGAVSQPGNSAQLGKDMHHWHSGVIISMNNRVGVFQPLESWLPVLLEGEVYGLGERVQRDPDLNGQKRKRLEGSKFNRQQVPLVCEQESKKIGASL